MPHQVIWNGNNDLLEPVPDGEYRIIVQAWDEAKNIGKDEKVTIRRNTKPFFNFSVARSDEKVKVELSDSTGYDLMFWFAKVYKNDGELVTTQTGEKQFASFEFNVPGITDETDLEMIFATQDIYGNISYQVLGNLLHQGKKEEVYEFVPESQWLESF